MGMTSTSRQFSSPIRMMAVSPNSFWIEEIARSRFFFRASAIFSAALSRGGAEEAGEAAALGDEVFSSEEEEEAAEAFWLGIGLGLAATVLMTISIWYAGTLRGFTGSGKNNCVLLNTCSFGRLFALKRRV